ncbi:proline racemase family protein [Rubinisphaera margarita]|uniref:proline racemase family protein n=1 Tax=Rubinisphaera margarita TaxID=2909586 RepID=UPI001EE8EFBD|nr:proline racemase family protein [Rubinisphaera margarita]MCG6158005.1 proline racemase family protein [Rubinisphaera margarita]
MRFIDSHTEGEPTRVIIADGPDLGSGSLTDRLARFARNFDHYRRAAMLEPRGAESLVGALLCEPDHSHCAAAVIFFNNTGYLKMCGHGTIGLAVTLAHMGRLETGIAEIQSPVGIVKVELLAPNEAAVENVPSYRYRKNVEVNVDGLGLIQGDIAWGGNWFFLVERSPAPLTPASIPELSRCARLIRRELGRQDITGENAEEIDHIEFFGPPAAAEAHSRNFVYCPGGAFDRSPCGTGTSAKLACLAADGKLAPGEIWIQESIIGSRFRASYRTGESGTIIPRIVGTAFICAEGRLIQQPDDPFRDGIVLTDGWATL